MGVVNLRVMHGFLALIPWFACNHTRQAAWSFTTARCSMLRCST
jgi:hypothetical protein